MLLLEWILKVHEILKAIGILYDSGFAIEWSLGYERAAPNVGVSYAHN